MHTQNGSNVPSRKNASGELPRDEASIVVIRDKTWEKALIHAVKGFGIGFLGFLLPVSARARRWRGLRKALALGLLLSSFRMIDWCFWKAAQHLRQHKTRLANLLETFGLGMAAGLSTLVALKIDPHLQDSVAIIWLIIRAIRTKLPTIPNFDVFVMVIAAGQLLSTWIRVPQEHSPSYIRFLNFHGAVSKEVLKALQSPNRVDQPCPLVHPNQSCTGHAARFWVGGLRRALPVYLPLHLLAFVFSKKKSGLHLLENLVRSTVFLSSYCTVAWAAACFWFRFRPGISRLSIWIPVSLSGLTVLFEHPRRRPELAAYCLTHALNSLWSHAKRKGWVVPRESIGILLMAVAVATIMHHHPQQSSIVTKHLFGIRTQLQH